MQLLNNLNLTPGKVFKFSLLAIMGVIVIVFGFRIIGSSFDALTSKSGISNSYRSSDESTSYGGQDMAKDSVGLSMRNIIDSSESGYTPGTNAEAYEVKNYNANIETRDLDRTCGSIAELKPRKDVIFENSSRSDTGCNYTFKVEAGSAEEILQIIEALDPRDLVENSYTIKRLVDDFTSETEILERKMESIEDTLADAISAYDELTTLATKTQDVENLAKIINSKISIIERLTTERINISTQLERIARSKAEQLDRLDYIYFNVNIFENKYIDGDNLKDSWKREVKAFVRDVNVIAQDISINLVKALLFVIQYLLYIFIFLVIAKFCWQMAKKIWMK